MCAKRTCQPGWLQTAAFALGNQSHPLCAYNCAHAKSHPSGKLCLRSVSSRTSSKPHSVPPLLSKHEVFSGQGLSHPSSLCESSQPLFRACNNVYLICFCSSVVFASLACLPAVILCLESALRGWSVYQTRLYSNQVKGEHVDGVQPVWHARPKPDQLSNSSPRQANCLTAPLHAAAGLMAASSTCYATSTAWLALASPLGVPAVINRPFNAAVSASLLLSRAMQGACMASNQPAACSPGDSTSDYTSQHCQTPHSASTAPAVSRCPGAPMRRLPPITFVHVSDGFTAPCCARNS